MAFVGSGNAKLILFGEHAVVHGHPALGIGLPGQLIARWTPGDNQLELSCPEEYQPSIRLAFQRIAEHIHHYGLTGIQGPAGSNGPAAANGSTGAIEPGVKGPETQQLLPGGILEFESAIPVSAGLGSSGAVCVAMARVIAAYTAGGTTAAGKNRSQHVEPAYKAIWEAAHEGERVFHGRPSGVDTGLALWQKLCLFTPQPESLPTVNILPGAGIRLVYGTVPREASCAANVAAIGKAMSAGDAGISAALTELGRLAWQAAALLGYTNTAAGIPQARARPLASALSQPTPENSARLGMLASTAMGILTGLGLSTPAMDTILAAGLAAGATGGKLSGGGAGGAFWLACANKHEARRIQTAVIEEARRLGLPGDAFTGVITI